MVVLGVILAVLGFVFAIGPLLWLGVALIIIGLILNFVPIGGYRGPVRGHWY
jgi:hypothetical protein